MSHGRIQLAQIPGLGEKALRTITFAYSGDPDDAFAFYGLESGAVEMPPGCANKFFSSTVQDLNERAIRGEVEVSAISSAAYPFMHEKYYISSAGASVGRGYGPLLASKRFARIEDLRGRRVATPGNLTTGNLLFRLGCPEAEPVTMLFTEIRGAIARDEVDAGVLIHEELLNYEEAGLSRVACLGEMWSSKIDLPLPVGLNVIRRDLGRELATAIVDRIRASILYGLGHEQIAFAFAEKYSIAIKDGIADDFVGKFANDDTVCMDADTLRALRLLLDAACEFNNLPKIAHIDVI